MKVDLKIWGLYLFGIGPFFVGNFEWLAVRKLKESTNDSAIHIVAISSKKSEQIVLFVHTNQFGILQKLFSIDL